MLSYLFLPALLITQAVARRLTPSDSGQVRPRLTAGCKAIGLLLGQIGGGRVWLSSLRLFLPGRERGAC